MDVVAIGELLVDFKCKSVDREGYPTLEAHPGGAPANFLAAVSKYGGRTALLGKVGDDTFGKLLLETLKKSGIDTAGIIKDTSVFTTLAFVTLDSTGDRTFSFARKPGADTRIQFQELNLKLIDDAKVFHFGTLSLTDEPAKTATQKAVDYAKRRKKLITFDPNLREPLWSSLADAKEQMLWGLQQAHVVKIGDEEVKFLFGLAPAAGAHYILENFGTKLVFVTCGANGCYFANAKACGQVAGPRGIRAVDTTGAGDIFGGSAVWKLLQTGKDPSLLCENELREITAFACTAASLSTQKSGGVTSVPEYEEIISVMERN